MYDATNLRLREVSLSYNFSKKWIQKTKVLKDVQLSLDVYKRQVYDSQIYTSSDEWQRNKGEF